MTLKINSLQRWPIVASLQPNN